MSAPPPKSRPHWSPSRRRSRAAELVELLGYERVPAGLADRDLERLPQHLLRVDVDHPRGDVGAAVEVRELLVAEQPRREERPVGRLVPRRAEPGDGVLPRVVPAVVRGFEPDDGRRERRRAGAVDDVGDARAAVTLPPEIREVRRLRRRHEDGAESKAQEVSGHTPG